MLTYQDLEALGDDEKKRADFLLQVIDEHEQSQKYKIGQLAAEFYSGNDPVLEKVQNIIHDLQGVAHRDIFKVNHKIKTNFYQFFVMQTVAYSFGNGVTFDNEAIKKKVGTSFDAKVADWVTYAVNDGEAYAYVTQDHIEPMSIGSDKKKPIFVPLIDENDGAVKVGLRYWQLSDDKPLRITLYEPKGITEYKQPVGEEITILKPLRAYKGTTITFDEIAENTIISPEQVEGIPIVKLSFINNESYIKNKVNTLCAYNALVSKLTNNSSDADLIYWVLKNCDGMDEADDGEFLINLVRSHILHLQDGVEAEPKQLPAPHEGTVQTLEILRKQMFYDFAAIDFDRMAGGNITQMEIKQAYANKDLYADKLELNFTEAMGNVLKIMGYEGETFHLTRNKSINTAEMSQTILTEAPFFGEEVTTKRLCEVHGMIDGFEDIQRAKLAEMQERTPTITGGEDDEPTEV